MGADGSTADPTPRFVPTRVQLRGELENASVSEKLDLLHRKLPDYETGEPGNPGEGFLQFESSGHNSEGVAQSEATDGREIISFKYKRDNFQQTRAYVDGEFRSVHEYSPVGVDIYWCDEIMLFEGSGKSTSNTSQRLESLLIDDIWLQDLPLEDVLPVLFKEDDHLEDYGIYPKSTRKASFEESSYNAKISTLSQPELKKWEESGPNYDSITSLRKVFDYHGFLIMATITTKSINIHSIDSQSDLTNNRKNKLSVSFSLDLGKALWEMRPQRTLHDY